MSSRYKAGFIAIVASIFVIGGTCSAYALSVLANITTNVSQPVDAVFSPDGRFAFVLGSSGVDRIRLSDNAILGGTISVGQDPYDEVISPDGAYIFVSNETSRSLSVIGTSTNSVIATYDLNSGPLSPAASANPNISGSTISPHALALSADGHELFVSNFEHVFTDDVLLKLDVTNPLSPAATYLGIGSSLGLALSTDETELWVGTSSGVMLVDLPSFTGNAHYSSPGEAQQVALSPNGNFLFTQGSVGSIRRTNIDRTSSSFQLTSGGVFTGIISPGRFLITDDSHTLLATSTANGGELRFIDVSATPMAPISAISVGSNPTGVTSNTDKKTLMVMRSSADSVVRIGNPISPPSSPTPTLAETGADRANDDGLLGLAVVLMAAGWILVLVAIRRTLRTRKR